MRKTRHSSRNGSRTPTIHQSTGAIIGRKNTAAPSQGRRTAQAPNRKHGGTQKRALVRGRHVLKQGQDFWNREYQQGDHFSLSDKPGSELVKFTRWFRREQGHMDLADMDVLDVGCGNGRNIIYLAQNYGVRGSGFDLSSSAIDSARRAGAGLPIDFFVHNLTELIPKPDQSYDLIIDMMVSHCLPERERAQYYREVMRLLRPGGFMMIKTFLREGDQHARRMIAEHPGGEEGSYIHPMIGIYEYVTTERAFRDTWEHDFKIHLLHKSHGYQHWGGVPYKRRYMVAYLEKVEHRS